MSYFKSHYEDQLQKHCLIATSIVSISTADFSLFFYSSTLVQRVWITFFGEVGKHERGRLGPAWSLHWVPLQVTQQRVFAWQAPGSWPQLPAARASENRSVGRSGFVKKTQHIILTFNMPALNWPHQAFQSALLAGWEKHKSGRGAGLDEKPN